MFHIHVVGDGVAGIDAEWPGLTRNLMRDIYGTHKMLLFGAFKFAKYEPQDFKRDIESAETGDRKVFGRKICSQLVTDDLQISHLSLYPKWLIRDDLFQIFAIQFAVSLLVDDMVTERDAVGVKVHCLIIAHSVVSLYDHDVELKNSIDDVEQYLKIKLLDDFDCVFMNFGILAVEEIVDTLQESFLSALGRQTRRKFVIVDRPTHKNCIYIFSAAEESVVEELNSNHVIGLHFDVCNDGEGTANTVKTWLHFGEKQCVRFWPEHLVWFIPQLFLRNELNGVEYLNRIYDNEYRHGFRVRLDDPIFNRYYKILTGYDHESVNYYRSETIQQRVGYQESLEQKVSINTLRFLSFNDYDSDAIFSDISGRIKGQTTESNVVMKIKEQARRDEEFHSVINELYDFTKKSTSLCSVQNASELWDCPFVKTVIRNLRKFEEEKFEIEAGNVVDFDHISTIQALDHLVTVHNLFSIRKTIVRSFIRNQVRCHLEGECPAFLHHSSRRRERNKDVEDDARVSPKDANDGVQSLCSVTMDSLSSAHCHLLHSEDILYRRSGRNEKFEVNPFGTTVIEEENEEKKGDDDIRDVPLSIDWGKHILQWIPFGVHARFPSFIEEMLKNPESTLSQRDLERFHTECAAKIEEARTRGINYTMDEMLSLKIYSDTNEFQAALRKAHWERTSLEIKRNFYQWAITMYRTFLFHAVPTVQMTLYHGLDRIFTVNDQSPLYNGPFSTTSAKTVARQFSGGKGLEFTVDLHVKELNPLKLVTGIDMKAISCHPNEYEVLLYSQVIPIAKAQTFETDDHSLIQHLMFSLKDIEDPITNKHAFFKKIGIKFMEKWSASILHHSILLSESKYGNRIVAHRLQHELNALGDQMNVQYEATKKTAIVAVESAVSLTINQTLRVHVFNSLKVRRGVVSIDCAENILIAGNVDIDTTLWRGGCQIDAENGHILIKSKDKVINNGSLSSSVSKTSDEGGNICISCSEFMNNGKICYSSSRSAIIRCNKFVNVGITSPEPTVIMGTTTTRDVVTWKELQRLDECGKEIIFDGVAVSLSEAISRDLKKKLSEFMFTVSVDGISSRKQYALNDIVAVGIPTTFPKVDGERPIHPNSSLCGHQKWFILFLSD